MKLTGKEGFLKNCTRLRNHERERNINVKEFNKYKRALQEDYEILGGLEILALIIGTVELEEMSFKDGHAINKIIQYGDDVLYRQEIKQFEKEKEELLSIIIAQQKKILDIEASILENMYNENIIKKNIRKRFDKDCEKFLSYYTDEDDRSLDKNQSVNDLVNDDIDGVNTYIVTKDNKVLEYFSKNTIQSLKDSTIYACYETGEVIEVKNWTEVISEFIKNKINVNLLGNSTEEGFENENALRELVWKFEYEMCDENRISSLPDPILSCFEKKEIEQEEL